LTLFVPMLLVPLIMADRLGWSQFESRERIVPSCEDGALGLQRASTITRAVLLIVQSTRALIWA
jgi:hypothetical protein